MAGLMIYEYRLSGLMVSEQTYPFILYVINRLEAFQLNVPCYIASTNFADQNPRLFYLNRAMFDFCRQFRKHILEVDVSSVSPSSERFAPTKG